MRVISDASLLLGAITPRPHYTAAEAEHREDGEEGEMGIDVRHLSALFVPLPHANSSVCLPRCPLLIRARSSHHMVTDWMTDGRRTLPPFSTLPPAFPPLSPLQTQLFRAIFFGLRFPQGGTARDVTHMLGVADWHQSKIRKVAKQEVAT